MSEVPQGWELVQLGSVGTWGSGGTPKRTNEGYYAAKGIPWLVIGDLTDGLVVKSANALTELGLQNSSAKLLPIGTLLVAMYGSIGKLGITGIECATNQAIAFCRPNEAVVSLRYLYHALFDAKPRLLALGQGGAQQNISQSVLKEFQIPLAPKNEQTRIANQLDTLLTSVQACNDRFDAIPALLKRFRQTVLNAATSGRLTEEWRTRRLSNLEAKESGLQTVQSVQQWKAQWVDQNLTHNESSRVRRRVSTYMPPKINPDDVALPEEWANVPLEDAVLMVVDCHNKTAPYCESGIPLVRTSNIRDGKIVWNDLRYVDEQTYAFWSKRCPPSSGDLIFTREAPIGEVSIVPLDMKLCLGQRTMLLRPVEHLISARYIQICLMAPAFRRHSEVRAVGSGVKHYRVGDVSELEIPIPGFSEQAEIVRRVEVLFTLADRIEARCTAARAQAQRLTPLVLAKAFRGELVPQDPNDEPASTLLARIASSIIAVAGKNKQKVPVVLKERAQEAINL